MQGWAHIQICKNPVLLPPSCTEVRGFPAFISFLTIIQWGPKRVCPAVALNVFFFLDQFIVCTPAWSPATACWPLACPHCGLSSSCNVLCAESLEGCSHPSSPRTRLGTGTGKCLLKKEGAEGGLGYQNVPHGGTSPQGGRRERTSTIRRGDSQSQVRIPPLAIVFKIVVKEGHLGDSVG